MISENGNQEQTFALRPEELDRICKKEILWKNYYWLVD
jgi:hypothetical protein